ncbi:unnamed protein product [Spodoptera littoralis]|uniref:Protein kinase domain-containing protein n=1 Tax=Spodoptera littoralis TaxID=7109 RepID=A0A9P0IGE3_SPOLI|nr:unnamed protein product [Spodoptera littoralis]CAH1645706.1 unnamed protein product [Spodoptera littoralis]
MMGMIWVVLLVALTGSHLGHCSPLRSTPQTYPHDASSQSQLESWGSQGGMYAAVPALALLITAVGLLLGCTWCYRHKDCKPNEGADNQLFTASATHLHDGRRAHPPDSGFVEPVNNNISEDNNNGPISLREMQNIANNNAAAYIVSENEERNRVSRESVVEFEPLPTGIRVADPLEHCADWFGEEDFPRNRLQYLREIGRGWFGRVVEGEVEDNGSTSTVAVKILNQNASLEDKARFLDEAKMYRDVRHENILAFITKCLQEDPWILIFELCSMDLQQYLIVNRPKMAILNESGVPLRLMCDVSSALAHLHSRGFLYGNVWCGSVQVRGASESARAVLGQYGPAAPPYHLPAPETRAQPPLYTAQSESWCLGTLIWEVCAWGASPDRLPPPLPDLPCPYRNHLYQVMQLCWSEQASSRPTAAQVQALVLHLYCSTRDLPEPRDDGYGSSDFEERWQRLKPNSIPKHDEHRAIVHTHDDLSVDMDTAVSRSSSIMSDKDMSVQIKSESLTNLHGSLEDVRNIYLTHNETATLECHQGNISLEDAREKEQDRSDASMDPWLKDIIAGSTDDVSYYKDVSDVIKNLDNILNSEKTSSSESSHQASPSRDNLSLDCKKDYPMQSSMVKSPGITNFQNILDTGFSSKSEETETGDDDELDRDTIGTLSHSFERHSELDTTSQHTLENLTPDTPIKDIDVVRRIEIQVEVERVDINNVLVNNEPVESVHQHTELPNDNKIVSSDSEIPKLKELCVASIPSASDIEQLNVKDCQTSCDSNLKEISTDIKNETKSIDDVGKVEDTPREVESKDSLDKIELEQMVDDIFLPILVHGKTTSKVEQSQDESAEEKLEEKPAKHEDSDNEKVLDSDLIKVTESSEAFGNSKEDSLGEVSDLEPSELLSPEQTPESVQSMSNIESSNLNETKETEIPVILIEEVKSPTPELPPEIVQSIFKDDNDTESATVRDEIEDAMKEDDKPGIRIQEVQYQNAIIKEEINTSVEQVVKETDDSTNNRNIYEEISSEPIIDPNNYSSYVTKAATNVVKDVSDFLLEERKISMLHEIKPKLAIEDSQSPTDVTKHNQESTLCAVHKTEDVLAQVEFNEVEKLEEENKDSLLDELKDANIIEDANVSNIVPLLLDKASPITVDSKENILVKVENFELDKSPQKIQLDEFTIDEEVAKVIVENVSKDIPLVQDVEKNDVVINKMEIRDDKISTTVFEEAPKPQVEHTIHKDEPTADNHEETVISVIANVSIESTLKEDDTEQAPDEILGAIIEPISSTHVENVNAALKNDKVPITAVLVEKVEDNSDGDKIRSDNNTLADTRIHSDNSTVYMDLINDTNNGILSDNTLDSHVRNVIKSCLDNSSSDNACTLVKNESTEYLDPPSFGIKDIDNFLHMEKVFNSQNAEVVSSTPLASDGSAEINSTIENSIKGELSETKVPDFGMGVSVTKLEQRYVPDSMSPFESPTKSHHTDTYDENSSVVLGPFENCTLELFKGAKPAELVDLPKEELLAFSSNFSEMNLETPSPLRDGNFLNEVPDIVHDDLQFDDVQSLSEKQSDPQTETPSAPSGNSGTEKRVSPLTPPNSPGVFLASTSQQKYIVDIDLTSEPAPLQEPDLSLQKEIELNQIELQITSKLAMAENENNMNIEYSGPLTVEGLVSDDEMLLRESDALPESYLAGNGGYVEDMREDLTLDEECVKALRNELELKLPLAQVAAIEPPCEQEWSAELPPPPELIVSYPGALSPIAEETGQQLSAYENDMNWNLSTRTESSESYPEPCNNSTDDVTELPTGAQTYTIQSRDPSRNPSRDQSQNNTYTLHRDLDLASSREITMSADSLNASPFKKLMPDSDADSPIDDKTYTKEEEKESLERISQVSPFLLSPTTDTSAPENSDNLDNATGVSTLSKTTLPTDAKLSKPSETQCLSKATSIDSWCSNDTLYNVEENFDDLAMDPDVPDFEPERDEHSESTDTLTHNDDEKEVSHCSTYIIHDSKSEACETFSPDSITANDNYTYTKVKTDNAGTTPSVLTKSDLNDSTKNTTKDLAYGTLMSGMPSYSNCTTEVVSGFDDWKVAQPELVRRSPMPEDNDITPPNPVEDKEADVTSPQLATEPSLKKLESVEISCLQDNLIDSRDKTNQSDSDALLVDTNSPNYNYKSMAPSVTSTPLIDLLDDAENVEGIPMHLPTGSRESSEDSVHVPNFQAFIQSVEVRPQDLSSNVSNEGTNQDTEILLDGESKTLSRNSNRDSLAVSERTPTYSDFENSALSKPQDVNSKDKSSQSMESGISSEDFQKFETSVRSRPQDLSSLIDASSLLLKSERMSSELAMGSLATDLDQTSQSGSRDIANEPQSHTSPPIVTNFNESHSLVNFREPNFLINFDTDDETEQPHSIIITETTMDAFRESPSKNYDSNDVNILDVNHAYEPHTSRCQAQEDFEKLLEHKINGELDFKEDNLINCEHLSPKVETVSEKTDTTNSIFVTEVHSAPHTSRANDKSRTVNEVDCNGGSEKFATVNFLNETFEELIESNVDDETKDPKTEEPPSEGNASESLKSSDSPLLQDLESPKGSKSIKDELQEIGELTNGVTEENGRMTVVTEDFLQNEKNFCQLDSYFPLLSDIRFTGPATEIMSTSFTQDSPTEPASPECPEKRDTAAELLKEWDSDSDSHTSNSSSGEFIWKDGDGHETSVVPSTHFDHQRTGESRNNSGGERHGSPPGGSAGSGPSDGSADSGSGSEGDEVEFVPSSWDCRAAPSKSSLRSLEQATPDNKKRVVFKRQKYHCVYEYPREVADIEAHSPAAYLPDLSTYSEWDPTSAEEAELGYGQLFGAPSPLDLYPLRAGIAFGADYDEDFFISSSARPFESLGIMSTTSQFFPGKHVKPSLLERDLSDDLTEEFPPPPSPLPTTTLMHTRTPSLDFTTPDSGVEDITPGSTTDDDFKKKLPETELTWRPVDSASSSESVSPSSPGGEALGGLRHTRDKLKLDLPPSPHIPSPRHNRVFNFVLDKPKRREDRPADLGTTPLVMTDDTPIVTTSLPLQKDCEDLPVPEPTFSTFGKSPPKVEPEQKLILTDEVEESNEVKVESPKVVEAVKGEGTVLDSGDEDSGIESSSKATLERNKTNVS